MTLDLHGFTTEEAIEAIDRFLFKMQQNQMSQARIVTGKGSGKIQKATIDYIKKAGYHWHFEKLPNGKANEGVIIVRG